MYVVRRPFRSHGQMMLPGSIVEPGNVKWFKTRLKDRYIVEVTEQTLPQWQRYFADKLNVSLKVPETPKASKEPEAPKAPKAHEAPKATKTKVVVKPVQK